VRRLGGLDIEKITTVLGYEPTLDLHAGSNPKSPGQYDKHYAPRCQLSVIDNISQLLSKQQDTDKEVLICFGAIPENNGFNLIWNLSSSGNFGEAAANLFKTLRRLDEEKITKAVAVLLPEQGLGMAINDRLRRASKKTRLI
jgi:L-threonylcarbamoyladenylate synthase